MCVDDDDGGGGGGECDDNDTGASCSSSMRSSESEQTLYAVKVIERNRLKRRADGTAADAHIYREVSVLQELADVPHVIQLVDFFDTPSTLYVVLGLARGGDLFDRLARRTQYTERDARAVAKTLLGVLDALHSKSPCPVVHRDLKPENLLLASPHDDSDILLADFGFARHVDPIHNVWCHTLCGTPAFVAPEIVRGVPYGTLCDLWSAGCLLYMLLGGYPPFAGENHRAVFRKIRAGDYVFHHKFFGQVSVGAKRLISRLLTNTPHKRWTARQALCSDWFDKSDADLAQHDLSSSLPGLQQFRARRKWKSATDAIRWASSAPFWTPDRVSFQQLLQEWDRQDGGGNHDGTGDNDTANAVAIVAGAAVGIDPPPATTLAATAATTVPHSHSVPTRFQHSLLGKLPRVTFEHVYELRSKLREGSYAVVWECVHRGTGESYAVKIIPRPKLSPRDDEAVLNEVAILQALCDNPYVVQLMDFYEEDDAFYIVMEYMRGGDVFDRIVSLTKYTEQDARDLVRTLLKAVASLHKEGVAHRDLKPQNLLLKSMDDPTLIRVGDFGFARRVHTPQSLTTRVGTPTYVAPEILKNIPHDERVDVWSVGVTAHVLLVGYPPFMEDDQQVQFQKIRTGDWRFYPDDWAHVSSEAKEFVLGLLQVDPADRWTVDQALRSRWIQEHPSRLSAIDLTDSLRVLREKKKRLRTLARAFLWTGGGGGTTTELRPLEVLTQAQDTAVSVLHKVLPQSVVPSNSDTTTNRAALL